MRDEWEPEPYELPLEAPRPAPRDWRPENDPFVDEESDSPSGVIVIDLA